MHSNSMYSGLGGWPCCAVTVQRVVSQLVSIPVHLISSRESCLVVKHTCVAFDHSKPFVEELLRPTVTNIVCVAASWLLLWAAEHDAGVDKRKLDVPWMYM